MVSSKHPTIAPHVKYSMTLPQTLPPLRQVNCQRKEIAINKLLRLFHQIFEIQFRLKNLGQTTVRDPFMVISQQPPSTNIVSIETAEGSG